MPAYGDYAGSRGAGGDFAPPSGPPPGGDYRGYDGSQQKPKEDHDKRNMMLAAGGALAVGAIGGAVIAEALGRSPFLSLSLFVAPFCFPEILKLTCPR